MEDKVFFMYNNYEVVVGKPTKWEQLTDAQLKRATVNGNMLDKLIASKILEGRKERGIKK